MRRLLVTMVLIGELLGAQVGVARSAVTQVNVEVTSATLVDQAHVVVEGTVTCDSPGSGGVAISLRQRGGIFGFRQGEGSTGISCGVTPTSFSMIVQGGPFHAGTAIFDASAFVCDEIQCAEGRNFGTVRIGG
jgi:hypothetical protein